MTDSTGDTVLLIGCDDATEDVLTLRNDGRFDVIRTDLESFETRDVDAPDCLVLCVSHPAELRSSIDTAVHELPSTPIIVSPRNGNDHLASEAFRAGATDYVSPEDTLLDRILVALDPDSSPESVACHDGFELGGPDLEFLDHSLPDEAFVIGQDGHYLQVNVRSDSPDAQSVSKDNLVGSRLHDVFPEPIAAELLTCVRESIESDSVESIEYSIETTDGTRRFEGRLVPLEEPQVAQPAVLWLARDVTERVDRERALETRRDNLETVDRINHVFRRVLQTLVEGPDRADIEREVCTQLVESDLCTGALVGERLGTSTIELRTAEGQLQSILDEVTRLGTDANGPLVRALRAGEIQITNVRDESVSPLPEHWTPLQGAGIESIIVVPIVHEDTVYGALMVVSDRIDAFDHRERGAFQLLGETMGFAINAVKNRRLLFADSVVELEIQTSTGNTFFLNLTEQYDCVCSLEWAGTAADDKTYQYVTIDGTDAETVLENARTDNSLEEYRLINDGKEQCTLEVRFSPSVVRTLINHGATIRDVTIVDGVATTTVEVPREADVRTFIEAVQTISPDATVRAQRHVDRPVQTAKERREHVLDRLTDRQFTALRLAYYGGYFDWPRGSTGEDIASAMDISPPTMHQHLRNALDELLQEFFEEGAAVGN